MAIAAAQAFVCALRKLKARSKRFLLARNGTTQAASTAQTGPRACVASARVQRGKGGAGKSSTTTVKVGGTTQTSGTTANNFSSVVVYTVTGSNGLTSNYKVKVITDIVLASSKTQTITDGDFEEWVNVTTENQINNVIISDLTGRKVLTSNQSQINVSNLSNGIYMVQVTDNTGRTGVTKFVKN